jgi:nitrite reductase/ring-hydroxylating ferredoxin subunit
MALPDNEERTKMPDGRPLEEQPRWRQDFPIDRPQDAYIARRDFTKFLALTSLAFVAGQFWIGIQNILRKRQGQPPVQQIAMVDQIPVGGVLTFNYPAEHDGCLLMRRDEQTFVAYSQKCTHLSCAVVPEMEHGCLSCPCHEGCFDMATGRPISGPPRRPLPSIKLEVHNGTVYATGIEVKVV